jgi:deaminated glutathione amidase
MIEGMNAVSDASHAESESPAESVAVAVAVAQFAPGADKKANLDSIHSLASKAASRGARIVVFPEYSSYFAEPLGSELLKHAESLDGSFVTALGGLARSLGVHLVAGMVEQSNDPERVHNTLVALSPEGRLVARYRKQHLYDAFGASESQWMLPGTLTEPETFDVGGVTVGLQTCYDVRFPEVSRRLADAGVTLMLVPAEWVRGPLKEAHWRTLLAARALENTVYVAAADHTPPTGVGLSVILDPMGVELAALGESTDVAVGWVSNARVDAVRRINPSLALRRYRVLPRED